MRPLITLCLVLGSLLGAASAQDAPPRLKVIATLPTYAELARTIGGDLVEVVPVCRPTQDIHAVAVTPAFMARVRDADVLFPTGLDAELWLEDLLRGSQNVDLLPNPLNPRTVALIRGLELKQVPVQVSRRQGDLHAWGNTHAWADPLNVRAMAEKVRDALVDALPKHADAIRARHQAFHTELTQALVGWLTRFRGLAGEPVVVHHQSWIYFLDRFGIRQVGTLEPQPRVAPTASHLAELEQVMQDRDVQVVVREPFQPADAAEFISEATGARVLELSTHPGFPEGTGILEHFEHNLEQLAAALGVEVPPADG